VLSPNSSTRDHADPGEWPACAAAAFHRGQFFAAVGRQWQPLFRLVTHPMPSRKTRCRRRGDPCPSKPHFSMPSRTQRNSRRRSNPYPTSLISRCRRANKNSVRRADFLSNKPHFSDATAQTKNCRRDAVYPSKAHSYGGAMIPTYGIVTANKFKAWDNVRKAVCRPRRRGSRRT
jgi:hypothetical protein